MRMWSPGVGSDENPGSTAGRSQGEKLKYVVTGEDPGRLALKREREVRGRAGTAPDVPLNDYVRCMLWRKTLPDGCKIHVVFSLFPAV